LRELKVQGKGMKTQRSVRNVDSDELTGHKSMGKYQEALAQQPSTRGVGHSKRGGEEKL